MTQYYQSSSKATTTLENIKCSGHVLAGITSIFSFHTDVVVKISKVCICENDEHYVYEGKLGGMEAKMPCGVCTACMGTIAHCGKNVTDFEIGDRVTIEPGSRCGCCEMCMSGCYNLCEESTCYMAESVEGGCLAKLPDCVCDEDGAMVQPLSMALHACNRAEVSAGSHVLVSGAGCMGLLCVGVAKAMGATKIMVMGKVALSRVTVFVSLTETLTKL
ncbi:putative D-xylulose reductase A [Portunus trituberculatus]|uniref:Putative D-xylulose reductase A n=1 Tax=Portunus trituberculatus TaxID=210409 RepID=A0A5B7ID59_PORTR|nr:putative D-xylulose reductase A [Portunus trituberculatus]